MKLCAIDFEYNRPANPDMGLMAVSICVEGDKPFSTWLYNDEAAKKQLKYWLLDKKDHYTFVAHNVVAEASCFIALGLEPRDFQWLDTYLEYKQLANHNNDYRYGRYVDKSAFGTTIRTSRPLFHRTEIIELDELFGDDRERAMAKAKAHNGDSTVLNQTLENAILNFLPEVEYDPNTKRDARHLILERKADYSDEEKAQILDYANDDTTYLIPLINKMLQCEMERTRWDFKKTLKAAQWRARYGCHVAKYTMKGIPLHMERLANLEANAEAVLNEAKVQFNQECYPIFIYKKTPDGWKMAKSTKKTNDMIQYLIDSQNLIWKKTKKGDYSTSTAEGEPLQQYEDIHIWLKKFVRVRNLEAVLKGYKQPDLTRHPLERDAVFRDYVGDDGRLRAWYGPYGTQTGRNAPGAKAFVFAQAAVMRALVNPPKGRAIFECIAEGTKVLTDSRGVVSIESLRISDKVWDGEQYVSHKGVIQKGNSSEVIKNNGVWATGNHLFMGRDNEWHTHIKCSPLKRYEISGETISWRQVWSMGGCVLLALVKKGCKAVHSCIQWGCSKVYSNT